MNESSQVPGAPESMCTMRGAEPSITLRSDRFAADECAADAGSGPGSKLLDRPSFDEGSYGRG